jgi:hypothetical protein
MNKLSIFLSIVLLSSNISLSNGQNDLKKTDDVGRIALNSVMFPQDEPLNSSVEKAIINKLNRITSKNGIGGNAVDARFIITATTTVLTKDITPTAPPMHVYNIETTIYIGDGLEGKLFASTSIESKGVGKTEAKAYMMAIKSIKPTSDVFEKLVAEGSNKIIEYYNATCDLILSEAKALEAKQSYDDAIAKCMSIPNVCKDCYEESMKLVGSIFQTKIDYECKKIMNQAQGKWSASQDKEGADATIALLSTIDPQSNCFKDATNFLDLIYTAIKDKIEEIEQKEWDMKMKAQQDATDLESQRLDAIKEVAKAYAKNRPTVNYYVIY